MSTDSSARLGKFAREIAWSAVREDPLPVSSYASVLVPVTLPIANAITTKASHPKTAVLRCRALQWPARAARVLFGIPGLLERGSGSPRRLSTRPWRVSRAGRCPAVGSPTDRAVGLPIAELSQDENQDDDDDDECA